MPEFDALVKDILSTRWPDGKLLSGLTTVTARMIAEQLIQVGWQRQDLTN